GGAQALLSLFSGIRYIDIPMVTTLQRANYIYAFGMSSSTVNQANGVFLDYMLTYIPAMGSFGDSGTLQDYWSVGGVNQTSSAWPGAGRLTSTGVLPTNFDRSQIVAATGWRLTPYIALMQLS